MASMDDDPATRRGRIFFRYGGRQYNQTIVFDSRTAAERQLALVEETIIDLERGKIVMPPAADPKLFIVSGGKATTRPKPAPVSNPFQAPEPPATLGMLLDRYKADLTPGSKEANTLATERIHAGHFRREMGEHVPLGTVDLAAIQRYVDARARAGTMRQTITKELATLSVIWKWGHKRGLVPPLPWDRGDLTSPKAPERPPFQTWEQITRRINQGRLTKAERAELWECLWLNQAQTLEVLAWVEGHAREPVTYPLFVAAAFTGARRGELLRSERDDWNSEAAQVTLLQKKADRSKTFTRREVPIHPTLDEVMRDWFGQNPTALAFATEEGRPINGRLATRHFRRAVAGGKWAVLHGWHTFRHSFASNLASSGVDQRDINEYWCHHTEEMERRYRHLLPAKKAHALLSLHSARRRSGRGRVRPASGRSTARRRGAPPGGRRTARPAGRGRAWAGGRSRPGDPSARRGPARCTA
jgi:integrase